MTAPARSSNRPAAGDQKGGPGGAEATIGHRWGRSVMDTNPAGRAVPVPAQPVPAAMAWSPSPVVHRVAVSYLPMRRRYRLVRLVAAAVVTLAVIGALGWLGDGRSARIPADTAVVRVGAGETLWDVAQRVAPRSDPRAVVERIRQLNRIEGSAVQPGQPLRVPDGR